ncbi:Hypothetical protein HVR_LOCUS1098 [uncultured virus]|nr:Hypothetical protein HVR_LOCUS1098 [uncultured virus]
MLKILQLNIIPTVPVATKLITTDINQNNINYSYQRLLEFIRDPRYIRLGANANIRTKELTNIFHEATGIYLSHTSKLPQIMKKIMNDHPDLMITKKVRTNGTFYMGLDSVDSPIPEPKKPALTPKERSEKHILRKRELLNNACNEICKKTGWTITQYQTLVDLNILYIVQDYRMVDIDNTILVTIGRLVQYINEEKIKFRTLEYKGNICKSDFIKAMGWDLGLTTEETGPIFTNRLTAAERTFKVGSMIKQHLDRYTLNLSNLPRLPNIVYPNIQHLYDLATWLKDNSLYNTRRDMAKEQNDFEYETPEAVDWDLTDPDEDENKLPSRSWNVLDALHEHGDDTALSTDELH